jgi:hypothetical protein
MMQRKQVPILPVYRAPKPIKPKTSWVKKALIRVLFPPIIVWDAAQFVVNKLLGGLVGRLLLPAQGLNDTKASAEVLSKKIQRLNRSRKLRATQCIVKTHDDAALDTLEINYQYKETIQPDQQQYLIHFVGNNMGYEDIVDEMEEDAKKLKCHVIGFNLRGVRQSTGHPTSAADLVTDGIAQVQRLLDVGVDAEHVNLKGFSIGAGVATLVAKHFHDQGKKVYLFADRPFSNLTHAGVGHIRTAAKAEEHTGHTETLGGKILGEFAKPFIKIGLNLLKWEMEVADAFKTIPESHKEYIVVRSSKKDRKQYGNKLKDDPVVTYYASLHVALRDERRKIKKELNEKYVHFKIASLMH